MKKIIQLLLFSFLLISCNKDEDDPNAEYDVEAKADNLMGTWYDKETIRADGSVVAYTNLCASKRDNLTLWPNIKADYHHYLANCEEGGFLNISYSFENVGPNMTIGSLGFLGIIPKRQIVRLTNKRLIVRYDEELVGGGTESIQRVYTRE